MRIFPLFLFSLHINFLLTLGNDDDYSYKNDYSYCVRFLAMGDWGVATYSDDIGGYWNEEVAAAMATYAGTYGIDFLMALGDNFYDNGVASVTDELWTNLFTAVYDYKYLKVPWYAVFGNHDYGSQGNAGSLTAQINYSYDDRWTANYCYQKQFSVKNSDTTLDIIFIDSTLLDPEMTYMTSTDSGISYNEQTYKQKQQLRCLEEYLKASTATYLIVAGHYPIFSIGSNEDSRQTGSGMIGKVYPLLEQYEVDFYFSGHEHDLEHLVHTNYYGQSMEFIVTGAAGKPDEDMSKATSTRATSKFAAATGGFAATEVYASGMKVSLIDYTGTVLYTTTRTPQRGKQRGRRNSSGVTQDSTVMSAMVSTLKYAFMFGLIGVVLLLLVVDTSTIKTYIRNLYTELTESNHPGSSGTTPSSGPVINGSPEGTKLEQTDMYGRFPRMQPVALRHTPSPNQTDIAWERLRRDESEGVSCKLLLGSLVSSQGSLPPSPASTVPLMTKPPLLSSPRTPFEARESELRSSLRSPFIAVDSSSADLPSSAPSPSPPVNPNRPAPLVRNPMVQRYKNAAVEREFPSPSTARRIGTRQPTIPDLKALQIGTQRRDNEIAETQSRSVAPASSLSPTRLESRSTSQTAAATAKSSSLMKSPYPTIENRGIHQAFQSGTAAKYSL